VSSSSTRERFSSESTTSSSRRTGLRTCNSWKPALLVLGHAVGKKRGRPWVLRAAVQDALQIVRQQMVVLAALVADHLLGRLQEGVPVALRTRLDELSQEPSGCHDLVLYLLVVWSEAKCTLHRRTALSHDWQCLCAILSQHGEQGLSALSCLSSHTSAHPTWAKPEEPGSRKNRRRDRGRATKSRASLPSRLLFRW
jgi:hypothetical protein